MEKLGEESRDAKGIGDKQAEPSHLRIASEVLIGDVVFADYPISAFRSAKSSEFDGLIGADVFKRFLVSIDFPGLEIALEPRPAGNSGTPMGRSMPVPRRLRDSSALFGSAIIWRFQRRSTAKNQFVPDRFRLIVEFGGRHNRARFLEGVSRRRRPG